MWRFNRDSVKISILWKLIIINGIVIAIAISLAGVSVKDYACLLFAHYPAVSQEESALFAQTMQGFLVKASIWAVLLAGIVHYFFVRRLLRPLNKLGECTRQMAKGQSPEPLPIQYQDEIGQLTADFNQLSQKLKEVEALREKMVSDISHELRTPLTNINGYLEALSTNMIEGSTELFQSLHEESLRITRLVEQLHQLNVWQAKKGPKDISSHTINMNKLIDDCIDHFSLELKRQSMVLDRSVEAAEVEGNEDGLKQVIHNLLSNALQYDRGGWTKVEGQIMENGYKVTVTNEGNPIPEKERARLFERFYRLDSSRSRDTGGSGLGLSLVKEIIEQHHGKVGVASEAGVHSFWFTIPMKHNQE